MAFFCPSGVREREAAVPSGGHPMSCTSPVRRRWLRGPCSPGRAGAGPDGSLRGSLRAWVRATVPRRGMCRRAQRRMALALLPRDRDNPCLYCHHYPAQSGPAARAAVDPRWQGTARSDGLGKPSRLMGAYGRATVRVREGSTGGTAERFYPIALALYRSRPVAL